MPISTHLMTSPLISVVVPTCGRPDLLARCLDRLAPGVQTLPADDYEVIVTDDARQSCEEWLRERYPWAIWNAGPRRGPAANRNSGARRARGNWIAFIDDDCLPSIKWLAAYAAALTDDCQVYEGRTTCEAGVTSPLYTSPVNLTGGYLWSCNMLVQTDTFAHLGGFDEHYPYPYLEDVDFRERLVASGREFRFFPEAVVDHPPRAIAGPAQLARYHMSYFYHWSNRRESGPFTLRLLMLILKSRIRILLHYPPSIDSVLAVVNSGLELVWTAPRSIAADLRRLFGTRANSPKRLSMASLTPTSLDGKSTAPNNE